MDLDKALLAKIQNVVDQDRTAIVSESSETPDRRLTTEFKIAFGDRTINEEKDPDDNKTGNLFPALNDEPHLQKIRHDVHLVVSNGHGDILSRHLVGTVHHTRDINETAANFKKRVFNHTMDGHTSFDEGEDAEKHIPSYSGYDSYDDIVADSNGNTRKPMLAASTAYVEHSHGKGDYSGKILTSFEHTLHEV